VLLMLLRLGRVFLNTSVSALASTDESERLELINLTQGGSVGLGFAGAANLVACYYDSDESISYLVVEVVLEVNGLESAFLDQFTSGILQRTVTHALVFNVCSTGAVVLLQDSDLVLSDGRTVVGRLVPANDHLLVIQSGSTS